MKLIWTTSSTPLSWAICHGLDEPVSHFAALFENNIVFQSDLFGVEIQGLPSFLKLHQIVYEKEVEVSEDLENQLLEKLISKFDGEEYAYGAFSYFFWRAFLWKTFNIQFPSKNPLDNPKKEICTQIASLIAEFLPPGTVNIPNEDLGITSPYKLWQQIGK